MQGGQSEAVLKQAVEEQLDLILKIEEERKLLKKENKKMKEEHQKMINIVKKYQPEKTDKVDVSVETEAMEDTKPEKAETEDRHVQADLEPLTVNTSKLMEAQELLKRGPVVTKR